MVSEVNGPSTGAVNPLQQRNSKVDGAGSVAPTPAGGRADVVSLTDLASRLQALTQSVADLPIADQQKVEAFREQLADGSYLIDPHAIAEKLAQFESLLAELGQTG